MSPSNDYSDACTVMAAAYYNIEISIVETHGYGIYSCAVGVLSRILSNWETKLLHQSKQVYVSNTCTFTCGGTCS